ncbi:MAG TPA: CehA/McbA family metallohydrolase [Planctomycetota bacterium]|nr:CehA/McbA family metallohydrolase [Planctomycetota bacterium]
MLTATGLLSAYSGSHLPGLREQVDQHVLEPIARVVCDTRPVTLRVVDADTGMPVPARITITDAQGRPTRTYRARCATTAVRTGVVYSSQGALSFELPPGEYSVYATRGLEWGLARARLSVGSKPGELTLPIRREVDTAGFVACDTHVHTQTCSGHGDATIEERLVSLVGEGIEFAVATDHNHNTDYRPSQIELGLDGRLVVVTGNEVTTDVAHFTAFPLDPTDSVPPSDLLDWDRLVDGMRRRGARVVVLNHPHWPTPESGPFAVTGLDRARGDRRSRARFLFDAMELVSSQFLVERPADLLADWFALLNHGESIVVVGVSDSHTIAHPVGQGRTYVRSNADDPAALEVQELYSNISAGRSSVSLGIFADVRVSGLWGMGDVVPIGGDRVELLLRVAAPSWIRPRRAEVYVDGSLVAQREVPAATDTSTDVWMQFAIELRASHDGWLVCVVTGDGVQGPWWPTEQPFTLAVTNPVYLDIDGDGHYMSPRGTALTKLQELQLKGAPMDKARVPPECDAAVAAQFAQLLELRLF